MLNRNQFLKQFSYLGLAPFIAGNFIPVHKELNVESFIQFCKDCNISLSNGDTILIRTKIV